jgi:hypothetical protein
MGFVILFIIESHLTYVNEFKNKDCFQCYFGLSFFLITSWVASASASVDSTISAYTLTSLAHPSIASMASSSVTSSKKMCLPNVVVVAFYVNVTGVDVLDRFSLYSCITANRAVQ